MSILSRLRKPKAATAPEKPVAVKQTPSKREVADAPKPAPAKRTRGHGDRVAAARVLLKPLSTEKGTRLEASGQYVFAVHPHANRTEVAKAIVSLYHEVPRQVNIVNVRGKKVRWGRSPEGRTKREKKAIVVLESGHTLTIPERG